jgi:hypothetical protein
MFGCTVKPHQDLFIERERERERERGDFYCQGLIALTNFLRLCWKNMFIKTAKLTLQ